MIPSRYAFGMILWELAARKLPYHKTPADEIRRNVRDGKRESIPEGCPDGYVELIQQCWQQDASKRPIIEQVLAELDKIETKFLVCTPTFDRATREKAGQAQNPVR